jgi:hypothetical protein
MIIVEGPVYCIEVDKTAAAKRDLIEINKIDFAAKNLTSNAGLFLLLEYAKGKRNRCQYQNRKWR